MLILDVGAKYGIHPAFKKLENIYNFHFVDADKSEFSYLKKNYRKQKNIKCFNYFFDNLDVEKFKKKMPKEGEFFKRYPLNYKF